MNAATVSRLARRFCVALLALSAPMAANANSTKADHPVLDRYPILFTVRAQYLEDHHNTATIFQTDEFNTDSFRGGSALKMIDLSKGGEVRTLLKTDTGIIRDPDIHFDGKRIVFSMRKNIDDDYHIYEIATDGTGLRQITSAPDVADIDPLYLPDGSIVFSSTREPKYCMCNRHIMANLFRMESDGANIRQIGKSTLFEGHATLTEDGRLLYDRWEYVDRNFGDAQALWTSNPDGTNHSVYWGNNTNAPGGVIDARVIPGTQRIVCILSSCHDRPWGALAIIDRRLGMDGREPVVRTWPADAIQRVGVGDWDAFLDVEPKYEDPFSLDEEHFLCSRMTGRDEQMGIYLVDIDGNERLLHVEGAGCYDPIPVMPHPRPPQIPERRDFQNDLGSLYVADVYEGTHMQGVERGVVKYLRVVETPEKRTWSRPSWEGQGVHCPAMNWHDFCSKRILGTVPVEEDGSAYFNCPSDRFVYFQLLDEEGMMVQSMRSGTIVQSGENTGCVGCHDNRRASPPLPHTSVPFAFQREPSPLEGWRGEQRVFNYIEDVQPIFTRHCVECHDYGKEAGATLNLSADRTLTFNTSYNELWRKKFITAIGAGPSETQQPYAWGSHASKLVKVLREGHHEVALTSDEFDAMLTWLDLNAPYYPEYETAFPDNLAGRSPLNEEQLSRLARLTGVPFHKLATCTSNRGPKVSFDRPELSPCLQDLRQSDAAKYQEALRIIQAGAAELAKRPRADMPGFIACDTDRERLEDYNLRLQIEQFNRRAIREGTRLYDRDFNQLKTIVPYAAVSALETTN